MNPVEIVKKKRHGKALSKEEIDFFIHNFNGIHKTNIEINMITLYEILSWYILLILIKNITLKLSQILDIFGLVLN